ncbi:alpha/beta fold hydrolase [Nocardia sp. NPDC058058]|uniref:alpha/beta fold hydrolase n=1 Tax=Nocardia sp. NPDC058058 TaxID=3346317 RepID=UPI0036D9BC88
MTTRDAAGEQRCVPTRLRDAPFESVRLPAGEVEYRRVGSGTPLLFVHGVFVNGELWRDVVDGLSADFECIVLEMPLGGHRKPMNPTADLTPTGLADLIGQVIETLGLGPVRLVANDSGGALSQIFASRRPDLVHSLVLTSCDTYEYFFPPLFRPLPLLARSSAAMALMSRALQWRWVRRTPLAFGWATKRPMAAEVEKGYVRPLLDRDIRRDVAKALRDVRPSYTLEAAEKLRGFHKPVLLLWGEYDRFFPVHTAHRLARDLPDARLELLADTGAFVPEDAADRVVDAIIDFYAAESQS